MKVLEVINKIQADLCVDGIAKVNKNAQQGYNFRGIDDIYNTLSALFSKYGLVIVPHYTDWKQEERMSAKNSLIIYTKVSGKYQIYATEDSSMIEAELVGEAMDSADKSTNKAMSAAYKYLCLQLFSIPTKGDNDADATTHEIKALSKDAIADIQACNTIEETRAAFSKHQRDEDYKLLLAACQAKNAEIQQLQQKAE
jgi:hypothetical protein